jgi:hypothetical protein
MSPSNGSDDCGPEECHVDPFRREFVFDHFAFDTRFAFVKRGFDLRFDLIGEFPDFGALFGSHCSEGSENLSQFSLASENLHSEVLDLVDRFRRCARCKSRFPYF